MPSRTSCSVGFGVSCSNDTAAITMPGVQKPHCRPWFSMNACCIGCSTPSFTLDSTVTPSPTNPLGVKGIGEAGTIGSAAAVMNAVVDALGPLGITDIDMPASPNKVWAAIQEARA